MCVCVAVTVTSGATDCAISLFPVRRPYTRYHFLNIYIFLCFLCLLSWFSPFAWINNHDVHDRFKRRSSAGYIVFDITFNCVASAFVYLRDLAGHQMTCLKRSLRRYTCATNMQHVCFLRGLNNFINFLPCFCGVAWHSQDDCFD